MESIISTFHIDWKIIIAQAVNFAIVFVVLYIFALKPLSKLMAERSEKIAKGIDDAKINEKLLSETRAEYEATLVKARNEANKIFQDGKKEAEAKKVLMLEDAKKEVSVVIENGKKTLEMEKIKMVEDAKKEIIALAMLATEKIISNKVSSSFDEKTVLDNVSLNVSPCETLAIVGFSGSGKSTVLKIISGLIEPDSGEVILGDPNVGMVFQYSALFDSLNILENVAFALKERKEFVLLIILPIILIIQ